MFYLVLKAGNQHGDGQYRDGMPVTLLPDGTPLSEHMKTVFSIVRVPDAMRPRLEAALVPVVRDGVQVCARAGYVSLDELAAALGDAGLVARWRSSDVVEVQDGSALTDALVHDSEGHDFGSIPDMNAIRSGTCTIGPGGASPNYANWASFIADLDYLTGNLAATQVASTTGEGSPGKSLYTFGNDLTLDCASPHHGDPTAGYSCTRSINAPVILLYIQADFVTAGTVEVKNLRFVDGAAALYEAMLAITSSSQTILVHDCIATMIDGNGVMVSDSGGGFAPIVSVWNCYGMGGRKHFQVHKNKSASVIKVGNCTGEGSLQHGFVVSDNTGSGVFVENCCEFNNFLNDFFVALGIADGRNNASEDGTGVTAWFAGSNNHDFITPANEFESLVRTAPNYLKVRDDLGGVCWDGGRTPTIPQNTAGIRGTPRSSSIGADEYAAPAPTVTSVDPDNGPEAGGTPVSVYGTGFQSGATVHFGANPATGVSFVSDTQIDCDTPLGTGVVDVKVTNPDLQYGTLDDGFTYNPAPPPTVSSVDPTSGPEAGGTPVSVYGSDFVSGATVHFGANPAGGVAFVSSTQLDCTTPIGVGFVDVKVTNPDLQYDVLVAGFEYVPPIPTTRPGVQGKQVQLDTTDFDGRLSSVDYTVQRALETLDDYTAVVTKSNRRMPALTTVLDGDKAANTAVVSQPTPGAVMRVCINGNDVYVADGPTQKATSPCYFSGDGGGTARAADGVQLGDYLYWNGSVAKFQLSSATDLVDFVYEV